MLIRARDVWKTYGDGETSVHALRGIDLIVNQRDFIAILGPSGSGKSSLLHLFGAMDVPTKGEVFFKGENLGNLSKKMLENLRLRHIGFIFQTFNLIPSLTVAENIILPMKLSGMNEKIAKERTRYLLEQINLLDRSKHLPSMLSGGQRQRVAIARALANNPDLLLADEPTGNLDSETGEMILHLLMKLNSNGQTIVMVTHNTEFAEKGNRVIYLRDGKLHAENPLKAR